MTCRKSGGRNLARVPRRGSSIVYVGIAMVGLIAFASLGVDLARVQLVKTELQRAADAAARAAMHGLTVSVTQAQTDAVAVASQNTVDGSALTLDTTNDIEFGTWDTTNKTFTVMTGAARSTANAIRISARRTTARGNAVPLLFGKVLGMATCNANASSIAMIQRHPDVGLVGLDYATISGNGNTDSFNSNNGVYVKSSAGKNGHVLSNGDITVKGSGIVNGDVHPGIGHSASVTGKAVVTGSTTPLTYTLSYPPPKLPATYYTYGNINLSSGTYTWPAGDYYFSSLTIANSATFNCTGPIRVYCAGTMSITGGTIKTYQNKPVNFQIYMLNGSSVTLNGQADMYCQLYCPQSDFTQGGNADIYGTIVAKSLTFSGTWNGGVHYDESITGGGVHDIITIVK